MKYIKKFENNKIDYLKYFWVINGNIEEVKIIIRKFVIENKLPQMHAEYLSTRLKGLYFGYTKKYGWNYFEIEDGDDIENGKDDFKRLNLKFGGEVKLINNEIVIDDFLKNIDSYNI
jgi:hypothetical protein